MIAEDLKLDEKCIIRTLIIFLLTIISCQSNSKHDPLVNEVKEVSTNQILPLFVQHYLGNQLHGWKLAAKENWDDSVFRQYRTDSTQINFILADLNCDSITDWAAILTDSVGKHSAFKITSIGKYYSHTELESYMDKDSLDVGLKFWPSGTSFNRYDGSVQIFDCGAVETFGIQSNSRKIFYSNNTGSYVIVKEQTTKWISFCQMPRPLSNSEDFQNYDGTETK